MILIGVLTIPIANAFDNSNTNCIMMLNGISNSSFFMLIVLVYFVASFLYYFGSFVLIPLIGLIMIVKVIKIRKDSRKLIAIANKLNSTKNNNKSDIRFLISQILASLFAIIFNLPIVITSILNISMESTIYEY